MAKKLQRVTFVGGQPPLDIPLEYSHEKLELQNQQGMTVFVLDKTVIPAHNVLHIVEIDQPESLAEQPEQ
jgi:hypothetical protein